MTGKIMVDLRGTIPPTVLLEHAQGAFGYSGHNRAKCPAPGYGAQLVAEGGWYAIVFEDRADRALDGYKAGRDDAAYCVADARKQNYPAGCLLVATADFPARWSQISEYVRGFAEVVHAAGYVCGLYADGECIRGAKAAGYIAIGWLTCSAGFPGSRDHTGVDVWQRCAGESGQISIPGYSIDTNYLETDFIHAWGQHPSTPTVPGVIPFPGRVLRRGDRSHEVAVFSLLLRGAGYHGFSLVPLSAAESFGIGKWHAVRRFQKRHHLTVDGIVGRHTWDTVAAQAAAKNRKPDRVHG